MTYSKTRLPASHVFAGMPGHQARVILADPPWNYRNYTAEIGNRDARNHYPTMSRRQILRLPVQDLVHPDGCHLFLWTTSPFFQFAFEVIGSWGFEFSSIGFNWTKLKRGIDPAGTFTRADFFVGMGHTTRKGPELCLLARCGSPRRHSADVSELIVSPRREHSRKPDEARVLIERYCVGPYVELFARSTRRGWVTWGSERNRFRDEAQRKLGLAGR